MSLRDIQKRYNINYGYTYRETTKAKDIIKKKTNEAKAKTKKSSKKNNKEN